MNRFLFCPPPLELWLLRLFIDRRIDTSTKLHPYDGVSELLKTFLARFENFASHFCWDEEEHLFNLRNYLVKAVGNVLWQSGSPSSLAKLIA